MNAAENRRFEELLSRYLDERLTPDEEAELLELLQYPARERTFQELIRIDREIADHLALPISDEKMVELVREDIAPPGAVPRGGRRSRRLAAAALAAALLLAAGASFWLLRREAPTPLPLARLEQVTGEVRIITPDAQPVARAGQELLSGQGLQLVGADSAAIVRYPDGTQLEVGPHTLIRELTGGAEAGKRVFLAEGYLTADVAKQPAGLPMVLATPFAEVLVLGTSLTLSNGAAATHVEIDKGKVQLTRKSDGQSTEVAAGFDAVVTPGREPLAPRPVSLYFTPQRILDGHSAVASSPDGHTLAAWGPPVSGAALWDAATGRPRAALDAGTEVVRVAVFAPDGKTLATGGADGAVRLWDVATGRLTATLGEPAAAVSALAFAPDGKTLTAVAGEQQTVTVWDLGTGQSRTVLRDYGARVVALSPDGRSFATGDDDTKSVTLWDIATGRPRAVLELGGACKALFSLAFSPDGSKLATSGFSVMAVWDAHSGRRLQTFHLPCPNARVFCMTFSPDGRRLALGYSGIVQLWDVAAARRVAAFRGHAKTVNSVAFASDAGTLVVGSGTAKDGNVRFWDLSARPEARDR